MQSVIATLFGLIASATGLLIAKTAGVGVHFGMALWVVSLWAGVFVTAFLCPKKKATWFKSHFPAWVVVTIVITLGAFIYGGTFAGFSLWLKFPIAFAMSAGSMFMIWLAPKVSRRPSV